MKAANMTEEIQTGDVEAMPLEELIAYFESEDMSDLWETLPEVEFEIEQK
jgi:hypothetical protein